MPTQRTRIELNNINLNNSLPYIELKDVPIKLLIDTGCYGSLLRPYIIFQHNTPISTCAGTKTSQYKANISLFKELSISEPFEFIFFPFHDYFDGILGLRDLKRLGFTVDTQRQTLRNNSLELPFFYRTDFQTQKIEIPLGSSILKNIKTSHPGGTEIILNEIVYDNNLLRFPSCIVKVKDETVCLEIQNPTNQTQLIELKPDFISKFGTIFNSKDYECFHIITPEYDRLNYKSIF